jgi:hypothetical protein
MFDFILLIVLIGLMLPFVFGAVSPIVDMKTWGFDRTEDKTMKQHSGDVLTLDELYADDSMTAAEIVLLTRVHDRNTVNPNRYRLPNGIIITVDSDYPALMNETTARVQAALDPALRYRLTYDSEADLWVLGVTQ